jgi:hypothetical protein
MLFGLQLSAQTVEFGLRGTAAFTQVEFNPRIRQDSRQHYYGGAGLRFLNSKNAGVQIELNYGTRGYRNTIDSLNFEGRMYDVIELPLLTHLRFGQGKFSTYLHVGSMIDYVLRARRETFANDELTVVDYELQANRDNRWNYGLIGGFGISYEIGPGRLQAEGRYNYYFGSIEKSILVTRFSQPRSSQLSLSYFVDVTGKKLLPSFRKKKVEPLEFPIEELED